MKFYLIETITFNDGKADSVAIYSKNDNKQPYTKREAISKAHKELGAWMVNETVQSINVIVKDEKGAIFMNAEDTKEDTED